MYIHCIFYLMQGLIFQEIVCLKLNFNLKSINNKIKRVGNIMKSSYCIYFLKWQCLIL